MRKFDYSFLDTGLLPANLIGITGNIYSLRTAAQMRKKNHAKIFTELEYSAKISSVKSSNAIEGIVTGDGRIEAIVGKKSAPLNRNEAEIAGYRDALELIHTRHENLAFRERDILLIHEIIMTPCGDELAGKYKKNDNVIVETAPDGTRHVRFRPVPAAETKAAMEQLELAYLEACSDPNVDQLLLIPCVILDFRCIHPFRDGNGRVSRLLSLLLLYRNGFDAGKYVSFEEQINKYKDLYYEALQKSSAGWETNRNDYIPFVKNFLSTLYMCYKELDKRFAVSEGKRISKTSRVEAAVLGSLTPLSKAEICAIHPDISPTTVEAVLGRMVKDGLIKKIGNSKGSRYIKNG
ncbi:MAG: Fic family protein [Clostridia bacterium]|nr:Fic family protein [Clostridia bacterium]